MKKLLILCLCMLACGGCLVWYFWPEYGTGYSEEQRRLWNERRELYPASWRMDSVFPCWDGEQMLSPRADIVDLSLMRDKAATALLKKKEGYKRLLDEKLIANRDQSAPDYRVKEPFSVDISRLPLRGMTEREIAERALAGDGDACLMMVQYLCRENDIGAIELSWRGKQEVEQWLGRAVALKRPGALFLKNFFQKAWNSQKNRWNDLEGNPKNNVDTRDVAGHAEYLDCLSRGDYILYRTVDVMRSDRNIHNPLEYYPVEEARLFYRALLREAGQGKVEAQRDLAALVFESDIFRTAYYFRDQIQKDLEETVHMGNRWTRKLPEWFTRSALIGLYYCGVIDVNKTRSMKHYREAAEYAHEAARQGDLTGMYLWMRYGITAQKHFSEREWKEIFDYDRILFESGYVPYVKSVLEHEYGEALDCAILKSFYSERSYGNIRGKSYLSSRGCVDDWLKAGLLKADSVAELRKTIDFLGLVGQTDLLIDHLTGSEFSSGGLLPKASEEVRSCLLEQLDKWVEEGDLLAIYTKAGLYEKGICAPVDLGRACALYQQAIAGTEEYPEAVAWMNGKFKTSSGKKVIRSARGSMRTAASWRMAMMVLNHKDFPGRDEATAYKQLIQAVRAKWGFRPRCYHALGQFHERGVGRPVNKERAMGFYTRGAEQDDQCRQAADRLAPFVQGEGIVEEEDYIL